MSITNQNQSHQDAWVIFSARADLFWLKILKPGYRHCSVLLHDGAHWITFDPMSSYTDVLVHNLPADFDLPAWFAERGHTVIRAHIQKPKTAAPWMVFSCVEAVKRVLGIHSRFIFTPWQLFKFLSKQQGSISRRPQNSSSHPKGDLAWEV